MLQIRRANERGHADHGWLNAYHTFSFSDFYDDQWVHFRNLRVMNEDRVAPGMGFGMHPHRDMEIVTIVLSGEIMHKDSMGNEGIIKAGDVQRMSAGTGVMHSEFNPSKTELLHLYQIWILPEKHGVMPSYEQKMFSDTDTWNKLTLVASPTGESESVTIGQDVKLYRTTLEAGKKLELPLLQGRSVWVQIIKGKAKVNGEELVTSDGVGISAEKNISIEAIEETEFLLFDLN